MNDDMNDPGPNLDPMEPEATWPADPGATSPTDATSATEAVAPAPPGPPGDAPPSRPTWKTWVAVASTAAVVGAAAVFGISAATSSDAPDAAASTQTGGSGSAAAPNGGGQYFQGGNGQGGPAFAQRLGGFGTISSIDGSTLTIEDQSGSSTKVVTSDSTTVTASETGSVDDIKVGDTVMVVGTGSSTEIAATRVTDDGDVKADADQPDRPDGASGNGPGFNGNGPPGGQMPGGGQAPSGAANMSATRGVVKSVGDGTFTVTGMGDTTVTVTTDSSTTVTISKAAKLSDLKVGDTVMVRGDEADGTITATSIREGELGGPMGGGPMGGGPPGGAQRGTSSSSDGASQ